ncbi:MAG TPA: hypothetical protein VK641_15325 [Terriglobales bacterium]|nr:hypothetical protein [Terriglobales bacterium]
MNEQTRWDLSEPASPAKNSSKANGLNPMNTVKHTLIVVLTVGALAFVGLIGYWNYDAPASNARVVNGFRQLNGK